jgi:multiple antibiotic resistance protein
MQLMNTELFNSFLGAFTSLFSVVNPLGMMPVFLALTATDTAEYRNFQARKASVYMTCILAFFLFAGTFIMTFFGISLGSLRIAGGLIVLRSGFELLNSKDKPNLSQESTIEALEKPDISLTPLAMPLLSGPGSIAATISMAASHAKAYYFNFIILAAIILTGLASYAILRVSQKLLPVLGRAGLEATSKIMGFIAMTVGVQFMVNGIISFITDFKIHP